MVFSRGSPSVGGDEETVEVKSEKRNEAEETLEGIKSSLRPKRAE